MHYPTIKCLKDQRVHAVKNRYLCACGTAINWASRKEKRILKQIVFRKINEINCFECKERIKKL